MWWLRCTCSLSWPTLLWLYLLFLVCLGGCETERPEAWREVVQTAIPEKSDKVGFRAMRAAERGVSAFVASADVEGAFDGIRHEDVKKALLPKGVRPGQSARFCANPVISRVE